MKCAFLFLQLDLSQRDVTSPPLQFLSLRYADWWLLARKSLGCEGGGGGGPGRIAASLPVSGV